MNLGIVSCYEMITPEHISCLDKICRSIWDYPNTLRFYNLVTESNENSELVGWANLYFGCKFINDQAQGRKLPRVNSIGNLNISGGLILARSSGSSPRSNVSSPRKLSSVSLNNLTNMASSCTHIVIFGTHDNLSSITRLFSTQKLLVVGNL